MSKSKEGGQLTLPQGTAKVVIYLFNYEASGWAAFDDVSLVRTDQSTPNETSYYFFGGRRVAMRTSDEVYYLHGDHLGSTSLVTEPDNSVKASQRYRPYGEVRPLDGTVSTDRTCTDRRDEPQWDTSHDQIMVAAISSSTKRETGCPGATVLLAPS
ncbi:MAG: hypothetical protein JXC32_13995 [Anaerolineae bacterium]|nr:hypothetical protein [Anaerolineae bacterium]